MKRRPDHIDDVLALASLGRIFDEEVNLYMKKHGCLPIEAQLRIRDGQMHILISGNHRRTLWFQSGCILYGPGSQRNFVQKVLKRAGPRW